MPSLEEIQAQIGNLDGVSKLLGRREIKELPSILWEDESLEKLVQGQYEDRQGILVATNKRLVFVDKGLMGGVRVEDFSYDKISSIQYKTGMMYGEITIFASGNKAEIKHVNKDQAKPFAEYVRARMTAPTEHASAPSAPPPPAGEDFVEKLQQLAALKQQGILSDDEFETAKKRLLEG